MNDAPPIKAKVLLEITLPDCYTMQELQEEIDRLIGWMTADPHYAVTAPETISVTINGKNRQIQVGQR